MYDYLIVGAGLYGAVFAHEMKARGKKVLVIDRRAHIAGNVYTEKIEGIHVHQYGAHIFHTDNKQVWDYVNRFVSFNRYTNSPLANYKGKLYNLPFNMNTFNKLWGVNTPQEAKAKIEEQRKEYAYIKSPANLEEQALTLCGKDIYQKLIKGYTEKQWGKDCKELPAFIIKRLPVRFTYDNNYFNDRYQGIPVGGYNVIIEKMLKDADVELGVDYLKNKEKYNELADKILYTGMIDEYYDYKYGNLEWRSLKFENEIYSDIDNYQGNAVVNYTSHDQKYTRIIEHKHFEYGASLGKLPEGKALEKTIITKEYPDTWNKKKEPYYPINNEKNNSLYEKYKKLADNDDKVIFGGRLGQYKYYDMDKVIEEALNLCKKIL